VIVPGHHGDMVARIWSVFVGMAGGLAIVGVLLAGHSLFFDQEGDGGAAAAGIVQLTPTTTPGATPSVPASNAPPTTAPAPVTSAPAAPPPTTPAPPSSIPLTPDGAPAIETPVNPIVPPPAGTVTLLDVYTQDGLTLVTVQVDGTSYDVEAGDSFGANYRVDSIDPGAACAQFHHADKPVSLCRGESGS
jgi:hypothetical protein